MKKVAVEDTLTNVKSYLENNGYSVDYLNNSKESLDIYDAIVVSGLNNNMLGIQNSKTKSSVIVAKGRTPEEIKNELKDRMI
ncbi:MAG: YkuS family protein [Clostridia bacterium]|nr:YkuS family protein [Clostridia bacterium]